MRRRSRVATSGLNTCVTRSGSWQRLRCDKPKRGCTPRLRRWFRRTEEATTAHRKDTVMQQVQSEILIVNDSDQLQRMQTWYIVDTSEAYRRRETVSVRVDTTSLRKDA